MKACGVDFRGSEAVLAVVEISEDGTAKFVPTKVKKIELGDDKDPADLKNFQRTLQSYLQDQGISHVVIKDRPRNGAMSAGASSFKMEAALQLIEGLAFYFV